MRLRLYLDEDISPVLATLLRDAGYDAVSAHEVGALRDTDPEQLARATSAGRAILTYNCRHFHALATEAAASGQEYAGIIISFHQYDADQVGSLFRAMRRFIDDHSAEQLRNTILVLPRPRDG